MALATLEAAIEAAGVEAELPFPTLLMVEGRVDEEERTVIRGVDVTPVFSVPRRKLGIDFAGCGLALPAELVLELFSLGEGRDDTLADETEPDVTGLCVFDCCAAETFSMGRVVVDSCVPELPVDAVERPGLDGGSS